MACAFRRGGPTHTERNPLMKPQRLKENSQRSAYFPPPRRFPRQCWSAGGARRALFGIEGPAGRARAAPRQGGRLPPGTILARAEEFNRLLYNEDVQVLMAAIGGNNTNSILPYIDYEYLKAHPKVIVGYSDTTALPRGLRENGADPLLRPGGGLLLRRASPYVDSTFESFITLPARRFPPSRLRDAAGLDG